MFLFEKNEILKRSRPEKLFYLLQSIMIFLTSEQFFFSVAVSPFQKNISSFIFKYSQAKDCWKQPNEWNETTRAMMMLRNTTRVIYLNFWFIFFGNSVFITCLWCKKQQIIMIRRSRKQLSMSRTTQHKKRNTFKLWSLTNPFKKRGGFWTSSKEFYIKQNQYFSFNSKIDLKVFVIELLSHDTKQKPVSCRRTQILFWIGLICLKQRLFNWRDFRYLLRAKPVGTKRPGFVFSDT